MIASLQSTRESISSLDIANQELLQALSTSQEEIFRLSTAGISLNTLFQQKQLKCKKLVVENKQLLICRDELAVAVDELLQKDTQPAQKDPRMTELEKILDDRQKELEAGEHSQHITASTTQPAHTASTSQPAHTQPAHTASTTQPAYSPAAAFTIKNRNYCYYLIVVLDLFQKTTFTEKKDIDEDNMQPKKTNC